jgi:hypothetical protein
MLVDIRTGGFHHLLPPGRPPSCCVVRRPLALCVRPLPHLVVLSTSCSPCPAPSPPPPSCHVVRHLPAARKHCHHLIPASSFSSSPHLLSSNCPLPTLAAASMMTLLLPLSPQSPPCQQTKRPSLQRKPQCFQRPWRTFSREGRCWNHPLAISHLAVAAPTR